MGKHHKHLTVTQRERLAKMYHEGVEFHFRWQKHGL